MTALRFQTGGRHQTSLASLQGYSAVAVLWYMTYWPHYVSQDRGHQWCECCRHVWVPWRSWTSAHTAHLRYVLIVKENPNDSSDKVSLTSPLPHPPASFSIPSETQILASQRKKYMQLVVHITLTLSHMYTVIWHQKVSSLKDQSPLILQRFQNRINMIPSKLLFIHTGTHTHTHMHAHTHTHTHTHMCAHTHTQWHSSKGYIWLHECCWGTCHWQCDTDSQQRPWSWSGWCSPANALCMTCDIHHVNTKLHISTLAWAMPVNMAKTDSTWWHSLYEHNTAYQCHGMGNTC